MEQLLFASYFRNSKVNPLDYCFNTLNKKIKKVDIDSDIGDLLVKFCNIKLKEEDKNKQIEIYEIFFDDNESWLDRKRKILLNHLDSDKVLKAIKDGLDFEEI